MLELEKHISPLIKNMFPSFYQEDGENFIAFVEAYFEFLEQNYQVLVLTDNDGFNLGDTVTQGNTTGTIVSADEDDLGTKSILVHLDSFDTFRCFDMNTDFETLESSSGATTFILHGGRGKRVTPLYWSRHLAQLRDIDSTIDSFILNFKEKYLKNIEFDISTNKQLLVKNSLDLYRSKGTERSIDLFFRLIYGVKAQVYYPGEDLFKLSAAEWVKPLYLEISSSARSVNLVGKQIKGVSSGATGFVERYIKRRVKDSFVYILYITNTSGTFETNEVVYHDKIYPDLPIIKGSLSNVTIINGSREFEVGDIVRFNSSYGDFGFARVSAISSETGQVDFIFEDGGYGYTISDDPSFTQNDLDKRTQSIVSEKVLVLSNVSVSNVVSAITVSAGGTGYNNTDVVSIASPFSNCVATPTTNSTGGILYITVDNPGSGFYTNTPGPVLIANSTGGTTAGSGATLDAGSKAQSRYFQYFEDMNQNIKTVTYDNASNNQLFQTGNRLTIGNSTVTVATATVIDNANGALADANGVITIGVVDNGSFGTGNTIYLTSNLAVFANVAAITDATAVSDIMGTPLTANLSLTAVSGTIDINDEIYQERTGLGETANATIVSTNITGTTGIIEIDDLQGIFVTGIPISVRNRTTTATITNVQLNLGVYNIANSYLDTGGAQVFSTNTGTTANLITISQGTGASFKVGSITEPEIIYLNTDLLGGNNVSNTPYMGLSIAAAAYGFPKNPSGNSSAVIFSCLNFDSFTIGTIGRLTSVNPGTDYNIDPFVLAYQPYLASFNYYDYIFEIENLTGSFVQGERLLQTNTLLTTHSLVVANDAGLEVGMKVKQGSAANGVIIEVTDAANTIILRDVQGTFAANATPLTSFSNVSVSTLVSNVGTDSVTQTAKGIVKSSNSTHVLVKRIEFFNKWEEGLQIRGNLSGATANIVTVAEDSSYLPIGLNAIIDANVTTANGTVTNLEITDSGFGYRRGDEIAFISEDGLRAGTSIAGLAGLGRGSGYYKTSKGFLSTTSKLQDGDYYQEYSYEVLSRIPLDKYSEMFKKVMHTAGTRFFGGVLLENNINTQIADVTGSVQTDETNYPTLGELTLSNTTFVVTESVGDFTVGAIQGTTSGSTLSIVAQDVVDLFDISGNNLTIDASLATVVSANVTIRETLTDSMNGTNDTTFTVSIFTPLNLFTSGEEGAWYDPSDLSTMYQNTIGSTAAAEDQPVGILFDKRLEMARGTELLNNTTFNNSTGLTTVNADVTANQLRLGINGSSSGSATQNAAMTAGKVYEVTYDIISVGSGVRADSGASFAQAYSTTLGTRREFIVPTTTVTSIRLITLGAGMSIVDNFSVKEVLGNHLTHATTANKPILRRHYNLSAEKITNGTFATNITGWLGAAGSWDSSNGGRLAVTGTFQNVYQAITTVIGTRYAIRGEQASGGNTGTLRVGNSIGDTSLLNDGALSVDRTFVATATTTYISCSSGGAGTATHYDNITVKEATSTNYYYLEFDGVDDHLLNTAPSFHLYNAGSYTAILAVHGGPPAADKYLFAMGNSASSNPIFGTHRSWASNAASNGPLYRNDSVVVLLNGISAPLAYSGAKVVTALDDGSNYSDYVDGTLGATTAYSRSGVFTLNRLALGALVRNTVGSYWAGRFYGGVIRAGAVLNSDTRSHVRSYLASKQGRTL